MNKLISFDEMERAEDEAFQRSAQASISSLVASCNQTRDAYRHAVAALLSKLEQLGHDIVVTRRGERSSLGPVERHGPFYRVGGHVFTGDKVSHITEINKYININIV